MIYKYSVVQYRPGNYGVRRVGPRGIHFATILHDTNAYSPRKWHRHRTHQNDFDLGAEIETAIELANNLNESVKPGTVLRRLRDRIVDGPHDYKVLQDEIDYAEAKLRDPRPEEGIDKYDSQIIHGYANKAMAAVMNDPVAKTQPPPQIEMDV